MFLQFIIVYVRKTFSKIFEYFEMTFAQKNSTEKVKRRKKKNYEY